MIEEIKKSLDTMGIPYYDTFQADLPSNSFADGCHLLKEGHGILAEALLSDTGFREWLSSSGD